VFFHLKKANFEQELTSRLTGNQTLCKNLLNKLASAEFIKGCIFAILGRDVGDLNTQSELMRTPLTTEQKREKKFKSVEDIETRKDENLQKALLKSDEKISCIEAKYKRHKKRTLELTEREEAHQKRAREIDQEKSDAAAKAKAAKYKKGGKGAKTVTHASGQDAFDAQGQGSGGEGSSAGPGSGGAGCSAGQGSRGAGSSAGQGSGETGSQGFESEYGAYRSGQH